jgi:phage baseplate assembly protein W
MNFPLEHDQDGGFVYSEDIVEEIRAAIFCILHVLPGEHPRDLEFGNHAALIVFKNPTPGLESMIPGLIKRDIENNEPRAAIDEKDVTAVFDYDSGTYLIDFYWTAPDLGIKDKQHINDTIGGRV